ncbi:MAG TPA: hypothetical protein VNS88_04315 [Nitrospiraceae bacterium]|nr:hypothetical protein [Nitrospiraceae bacterium]
MAAQRSRRSSRSGSGSSRGLGNVEENIKKQANRYKKAGWIKMDDGESVVARVVDVGKDFRDGFVHQVEFKGQRGTFTRDVMCLDQDDDGTPCPGCRDDLERRYKFWCRAIEREAEIENDSGKVTGYADEVKILSGGKRMASALNKKHKKHDLSKRDIEIERDGTGFDTDYSVEWVDEKDVPLTKEDIALVEESEIDLERYAYVPDFDDFFELPDRDGDDEEEDSGKRSVRRGSAFGAKSRASRNGDNDDDDDDDDRPPRRRSSKTVKPRGGLADIKARKASGKSSEKPAIRRRRTR